MIDEIEARLNALLPGKPTSEANPGISELTRDLMKSEPYAYDTCSYTHSVCHLFEQYGQGGPSYLNSPTLFPIAEELVDFTLKNALNKRDFGCVGRIVHPIMDLNLVHLEESSEGFLFKPPILTDEKFIERFSLSGETKPDSYLVAFCKSDSIGEFFPKFTEALRKEEGLEKIVGAREIVPGVFIDVDNTLIEYDNENSKFPEYAYKKLPLTHEYALSKLQEGVPVVVFTGRSPEEAIEKLSSAGVDERLRKVEPKKGYIGKTLEICIDDTLPVTQGFRAKTHYESGKIAWDTEYA